MGKLDIDADVKALTEGFNFFRERYYVQSKVMPELVEKGSHPKLMVISCVDSRSCADTVLQMDPGKAFGFRAPGAIIRPYQEGTALAATLELAIGQKGIRDIILMGHTHCAAIQGLVHGNDGHDISSFVTVAKSSLDMSRVENLLADDENGSHVHGEVNSHMLRRTEEKTVLLSAQYLRTYPAIKELGDEVRIRPWMFNMRNGLLTQFDEASNRFELIAPAQIPPGISQHFYVHDDSDPHHAHAEHVARGAIDKSSPDPELIFVHAGEAPGARV